MKSGAKAFFDSIRGKKAAFIGIGVNNTDSIKLFLSMGIDVIACDRKDRTALGGIAEELESLGAKLRLGEDYLSGLDADIVFRTPGMRFFSPELTKMRERGLVVTSEMELFFDICPCRIIAVTGSEGKTTTSTIIAEILKNQGKTVYLGGNIGKPLLPCVFDIQSDDIAVVELSSFQLISMRPAPDIAIVKNVTPNHLDMHDGMEEYIGAKKNIFLHQNAFSKTILNADNDITRSFAQQVRGQCLWFSLEGPVDSGAYLGDDGVIYFAKNGVPEAVMDSSRIKLPGRHNIENYLTAVCAVRELAGDKSIVAVAESFGGVEHRQEFIRELGGVKWYNDSIASSPTRVIAWLRMFEQKLILIAGGYDKQIPFEPMAPDVVEKVRLLILTGPTAPKIEAAVKSCPGYVDGGPEIVMAADIPEAVKIAHEKSRAGDIVSLSPACASYDAYPMFEARGRHFKELVTALKG